MTRLSPEEIRVIVDSNHPRIINGHVNPQHVALESALREDNGCVGWYAELDGVNFSRGGRIDAHGAESRRLRELESMTRECLPMPRDAHEAFHLTDEAIALLGAAPVKINDLELTTRVLGRLAALDLHPTPTERRDTMEPKRYTRRPDETPTYAMQWDGTVEGATQIINWVLENGGTARYHEGGTVESETQTVIIHPLITVTIPSRTKGTVREGSYVVLIDDDVLFDVMSAAEFDTAYQDDPDDVAQPQTAGGVDFAEVVRTKNEKYNEAAAALLEALSHVERIIFPEGYLKPGTFDARVELARTRARINGYDAEHDDRHGMGHLLTEADALYGNGRDIETAGILLDAVEFLRRRDAEREKREATS